MISIIITTFNNWELTYNCIESVKKFTNDYEIIVADDCSIEENTYILNDVKIVRTEKNLGYLLNCNNAVKEAKGDIIILLNNDTLVTEGWSEWILKTFEDKSVGIVGGKLINPQGLLCCGGAIFFQDGLIINYGRGLNPFLHEFNYLKEVDGVTGACFAIRRELWEKCNGFDERYAPAYCEDSDLCMQIRLLGFKVIYQPNCIITHCEGRTYQVKATELIKINRQKFYQKWQLVLLTHSPQNDLFHARDRSYGKRTHLLSAEYTKDKECTIIANIKRFQKLGLCIKFLIKIPNNVVNLQMPRNAFINILGQMGVECIDERYLSVFKKFIDNTIQLEFIN